MSDERVESLGPAGVAALDERRGVAAPMLFPQVATGQVDVCCSGVVRAPAPTAALRIVPNSSAFQAVFTAKV